MRFVAFGKEFGPSLAEQIEYTALLQNHKA